MKNGDNVSLAERMRENAELTEAALAKYFEYTDSDYGVVIEAQRHSLLGGGKRVRPFLVNEVARMLGGDADASMPLACAVEMVHTYSLIHDDLPCMDDDDMRRGKPSCHKRFGEANALLAGDALLTRAFSVIAHAESLTPSQRAEAIALLADAAGDRGMIGGQVIDLAGEGSPLDFDKLIKLHTHKTGALIRCAAMLGCIAAGYGADTDEARAISLYAARVGLAFQVLDDVLDAVSSTEELGKSVGSDVDNNKTTFMSFYEVDGAREYASQLTDEAVRAISHLDLSDTLISLAYALLERKN